MEAQYDVLSPWAEVDAMPLKGLVPRLKDLNGRTIGLFEEQWKIGAGPMLSEIERQLKARFPGLKFSWFRFPYVLEIHQTDMKAKFDEWVSGIDAAISAIGD